MTTEESKEWSCPRLGSREGELESVELPIKLTLSFIFGVRSAWRKTVTVARRVLDEELSGGGMRPRPGFGTAAILRSRAI